MLGVAATGAVLGCSSGSDDGPSRDDAERSAGGGGPDGEDAEVIAYGEDPRQRGALHVPPGDGPHPVVVLVHGGFWRPEYDRSLMDPLVASVVAQGWAAWNVDHRPIGDGGGWPTTFTDVAAAVDHLDVVAAEHALDPEQVAVVGHASGGTLALWSAARAGLPDDAPGADPVVRPVRVAALAGVVNLAAGSFQRLGRGAVDELMGVAAGGDDAEEYGLASPIERLPLGTPTLLVHGGADPIVPVAQSMAYRDRAGDAGDDVTALLPEDLDHFGVIDPDVPVWSEVVDWLSDGFT